MKQTSSNTVQQHMMCNNSLKEVQIRVTKDISSLCS